MKRFMPPRPESFQAVPDDEHPGLPFGGVGNRHDEIYNSSVKVGEYKRQVSDGSNRVPVRLQYSAPVATVKASWLMWLALGSSGPTASASGVFSYETEEGVQVFTDAPRASPPAGRTTIRILPARPSQERSEPVSPNRLFMYSRPDGSQLLTGERQRDSDLTLLAVYGRPTAALACDLDEAATMREGGTVHDPLIRAEASRFQLDPVLIKSIIWVESCFNLRAVSPAGAEGLMQLMPGTAAELGVSDSFVPEANLRGGITYFVRLLQRFDHDTTLALAAYNAGPTAVDRYAGIPPYLETRNYVQRVLDHYERHATARPGAALPAAPNGDAAQSPGRID